MFIRSQNVSGVQSREASTNRERSIVVDYPKTQQNSPRDLDSSRKQAGIKKRSKFNQSVEYVNPISVQEVVNSSTRRTKNLSVFGFNGYKIPDTSLHFPKAKGVLKFHDQKSPHFIDEYIKSKAFLPPAKYDVSQDWSKEFRSKGKFSKLPKKTFTAAIIESTKQRSSPGPGSYESPSLFKSKKEKFKMGNCERYCDFLEEASFRGLSTPASKYTVNYVTQLLFIILQKIIDPNIKYDKFTQCKNNRGEKIVKDGNSPSPGDYDVQESFSKTQTRQFNPKINKYSPKCYVEEYVKQRGFLPGVGQYKVKDEAYQKISKTPNSMRKFRQ